MNESDHGIEFTAIVNFDERMGIGRETLRLDALAPGGDVSVVVVEMQEEAS